VTDTGFPYSDLVAVSLASLPGGDVQPPTASATTLVPVDAPGTTSYTFDVRYQDDTAIDIASLGTGDVVVTGPNGFRQVATFIAALPTTNEPVVAARYRITPPAGVFDAGNNGTYTIEVIANEVKDTAGNALPAGPIPGGTFTVNVPLGDGPDLQAVSLQAALPPSVVGGARAGKVKPLLLSVTNAGNQPAAGAVTVRVVASADDFVDANDATVVELPNQKLKLAPGKSKVFKLKPAAFPAVADGDYRLLAVVDAGGALAERIESNNAAALAGTVRIAAPFVDLGITQPVLTGRLAAGKKATLLVTATNGGNQVAKGVQQVRVRLTTNPADPAATSRTVDTSLKLNLKPGMTRALHAKLALPADLPAGTYFVVVELLPGAPWTDPNAANDVATSAGAYAV
jgi:hypothetical protein